jgi:hypothetical protein
MNSEYRHPAFPPPPHPEVALWRYLDSEKFSWFIENQRLFMPSAQFLGDPLEGITPVGHDEWWKGLIENAESEAKRKIIEGNYKKLQSFADAFRPHHYVSCWHMNSVESSRMWKAYTESPDSVAVTTSYSALRSALPKYVEIGMVRYIDYENEQLPSLNMFEYITHKNINFCFEREVRAVALPPVTEELGSKHFQENHFESERKKGFLVFAPSVDITSLIHRVVLHPEASLKFKENIRAICKNSNIPGPTTSEFMVGGEDSAL